MKKLHYLMSILCGALLMAVSMTGYAQSTGTGLMYSFVYATASDLIIDQPATVQPIPNMSVDVLARPPLLVRFCGAVNLNTPTSGSMRIIPLLDGAVAGSEIQFTAETIRLPHCFTWVLENFAGLVHNVSIGWLTTGAQIVIQDRTLTVEGIVLQR